MGLSKNAVNKALIKFAENTVETAGIIDDETCEVLIRAFSSVPRHSFIADAFNLRAYEDIALPIGFGQTISRPSTVARMLGIIGIRPGMRVLEIGCGSGYCSAVMSAAGAHVYSVECVGLLAQKTRKLLDALNYQKVIVHRGDGRNGWKEHAPYDAIVVSAAFPGIEPSLIAQLKNPGGRMIAPIGDSKGQILTLWEAKAGGVLMYQLEACNFVEGK